MKTPPENSTIINICIIPPKNIGKKCVQLSQSLKSEDTMFVLDGKNKFAHMTVFMARFNNNEIAHIINTVEKKLGNIKSFLCQHTGYFMNQGRYFEASYLKSKEFITLHKLITDSLKALRINPGNPFEEGYFTPYTAKQQQNAQETGYDLAYNLYRPHITLTRCQEGKVPEKLPELEPFDLSFRLDKIGVYKADDNGAIYEKLAEFSLE